MEFLLSNYDKERQNYVSEVMNVALKYYDVSLEIPKKLGLSIENLNTFKNGVDKIGAILPKAITTKAF
jgi:hypothetical protein